MDRLIIPAVPNVQVIVDAPGCILLRTTGTQHTISNVDALKEALDLARVFVAHPEAAVHVHTYRDDDMRPNDYAEQCRHPATCATTRSLLIGYRLEHAGPAVDRLPGWPDPDARRTY